MLTRNILFLVCFLPTVFASTTTHAATFLESGGKVVIEAESSPATGQWSRESKVGGAKGGSYLVWNGPDLFSGKSAGRDTLRYTFRVQKAGNYELRWRSYIAHGNNSTEANDSWVRFPTGKNIGGQHALNGWTKVFQNQPKQWSWSSKTVDHVGKSVRQYFSKGDHVIEISGRSRGHAIDRIVLYRYAEINYSQKSFDGFGQSSTVGGKQQPQDDQSAAEDKAKADADPKAKADADAKALADSESKKQADANDEATNSAQTTNATAPVLSVRGSTLTWNRVEARSINVHGSNGEWLESLPGSSTSWNAPGNGSYFVVATNNREWKYWGRSNSVEVNTSGESNADTTAVQADAVNGSSENEIIETFDGAVYSRTSAEIFWSINSSADNLEFEVHRDGEVVFTGSAASYYDNTLTEGTKYVYRLSVLDDGKLVESKELSVTTLGISADSTSDAVSDPTAEQSNDGVNLRGVVYSRKSLEIMWDRSKADDADLYLYNVYQNEQLVASSNSTSYYVTDLNEGQTYRFVLRIQDASGTEGKDHEIELTTFSDGDKTIVLTRASSCESCASFDLQILQSDGAVVIAADLFADVHWLGLSSAEIDASSIQITRGSNAHSIFVSGTNGQSPDNGSVSVVEIDVQSGARLETRVLD